MAKLSHSSDPPRSIFPYSPRIASPVKTLDESSPTAPIRALVTQSLVLSSPIRQIRSSSPAISLAQTQNPEESSSSPSDKTNVPTYSANREDDECRDSQITRQIQISPANNGKVLQIASTSYNIEANRDSYNRPPKRANYENESDDDSKIVPIKPVEVSCAYPKIEGDLNMESKKPIEISWSYSKIEPTGVGAGLENSGNTCFIASVLQCFTHTVPLIESLRSYNNQVPCNCGNEKFCVRQALRDHIELALRSSGDSLPIDRFRDNLKHFSSDFEINDQEDAHEFLQSFLDKMERCCEDVNIVDHVFGGRLRSRLQCCNCNSFSDTLEPSLGWSLEIEDVDYLLSALESFTRVEKLEDQLTCDNCKMKVSKKKQLKLDKLPMVATFHLKRFKNNGLFMEKISKPVGFPLELDLLPYMSSDENPEVSTKYHLYAFVEHLGSGVSFGHYSSYVRSAPETWHNFDDADVMKVSEGHVRTQNAYILFYAREGTKLFSTSFEELKPVAEATLSNSSPKSVLETTHGEECTSDNSYDNVSNSSVDVPDPAGNHPDYSSHEPQEEVFHSAESSSGDDDDDDDNDNDYMSDALESLEAVNEFEKPLAEISHQEPKFYPSGSGDASVHVPNIQKKDSSPKRKAGERAIPDGAQGPMFRIRKQYSFPKRQGRFQIQRSHLQMKKKQEETRGLKTFRNINAYSGADQNGKGIAFSYLRRCYGSHRYRILAAALGSPIKKKKIKRSFYLHKHL